MRVTSSIFKQFSSTKAAKLRDLLTNGKTNFIMEAHNGLSAKIVEEAGFQGIWASGLSISAQLGVRDSNEASWTQVLDVCEYMSDASEIPILLDGDTGYGNFNNARRLIKKLEQRKIAGVCLEDKIFPKRNSLLGDQKQELADINEFCKKIQACKDTQTDKDFNVVARVEALIAGWGHDEAIKRADAYRKAGADAILIHSKINNVSEIEKFLKEWNGRHPVVIVPTMYADTPTDLFREWGVNLIIWANHNLRASVGAMQQTCKMIKEQESIAQVEKNVVSVKEIFRLQDEAELKQAEKKYL